MLNLNPDVAVVSKAKESCLAALDNEAKSATKAAVLAEKIAREEIGGPIVMELAPIQWSGQQFLDARMGHREAIPGRGFGNRAQRRA